MAKAIKFSNDQKERIRSMYLDGHGWKAISRDVLGRESTRPIIRAIEEMGIERRDCSEGQRRSPNKRKGSEMWVARRRKNIIAQGWKRPLKGSSKIRDLPLFKVDDAEQYRRRYKNDPAFRAKELCRRRFKKIVHEGAGHSARMLDYLGCDRDDLRAWIESLFEPWMNWGNLGQGEGTWNIDHVAPCSWFDHTSESDLKLCWNHQNLRPLSWEENMERLDSGLGALAWFESIPETPVTMELKSRTRSQLVDYQQERLQLPYSDS